MKKKWTSLIGIVSALSILFTSSVCAINVDNNVIMQVQQTLNSQGYDAGAADGILGPKTNAAIERYKGDKGLSVNSTIDEELLNSMSIAVSDASNSADNSVGVPADVFVSRYNTGVGYYNRIAERDGYFSIREISTRDLQKKDFAPEPAVGFNMTFNEGGNNDYTKIGRIKLQVKRDLADNNIMAGQMMACIYALDTTLTDCSQALEIWKASMNGTYGKNGISYIDATISGSISFEMYLDEYMKQIKEREQAKVTESQKTSSVTSTDNNTNETEITKSNEKSNTIKNQYNLYSSIAYVSDNLGTAEQKKELIEENFDILNATFQQLDLSDSEWVNYVYCFILGWVMKLDSFQESEVSKNWKIINENDECVEYVLESVSLFGQIGSYELFFVKDTNLCSSVEFYFYNLSKEDVEPIISKLLGTGYSEKGKMDNWYAWDEASEYVQESLISESSFHEEYGSISWKNFYNNGAMDY